MPRIHFTDDGDGFPVVFLHGFCETHQIWRGVLQHLRSSWRVLAADLPGFGKSQLPAKLSSLDEVAEILIQWLQSLNITQCIMLGHSLGGYLTLAVAHKKPGLLASFGLIHSTAYADSDEKKANRNRVIDFIKHQGVSAFVESFIPPLFANPRHAMIRQTVLMAQATSAETVLAYTAAMRDRPDRTDILSAFNGKVLWLAGTRDPLISTESVAGQALLCRQPVVAMLEGVAHMGMLENETETVRILKSFLESTTATPAFSSESS